MYYMFLADGFEETEALVTYDMLKRAGIEVKTVSLTNKPVKGTHGIKVFTDTDISHIGTDEAEGIILPGGMPGTENLYSSARVLEFVDFCFSEGKLLSAICAAPVILGRKGILKNKKAVCFPGFENQLEGAELSSALCIRDGNIITAKGAGAVFEFSHEIISYIKDSETADRVISEIQHGRL